MNWSQNPHKRKNMLVWTSDPFTHYSSCERKSKQGFLLRGTNWVLWASGYEVSTALPTCLKLVHSLSWMLRFWRRCWNRECLNWTGSPMIITRHFELPKNWSGMQRFWSQSGALHFKVLAAWILLNFLWLIPAARYEVWRCYIRSSGLNVLIYVLCRKCFSFNKDTEDTCW